MKIDQADVERLAGEIGITGQAWPDVEDWGQLAAFAQLAASWGREHALDEALRAVNDEALVCPTESEGDEAYSNAIGDCAAAIRSLLSPQQSTSGSE